MRFDLTKFAPITVQNGSYRDAEGGRVDVQYIGEPDASLCSFMGTDRTGARRFYRQTGLCPAEPHKSLVALWPADEPDRYFALTFDLDEQIYGVVPTRYADGAQFRQACKGKHSWGIRIGRNEDNSPDVEVIQFD